MRDSFVFGLVVAAAFCLCSVSCGTLKAAAAEAINDSQFEARGGWPSPPLHGNEVWDGPKVIALALPIALLLIVALWIAAYNTLRAPPPQIGWNAGIVESAGWGGQASSHLTTAGGWGWGYDAAASEQQASVASDIAAQTVAATAGVVNPAGVAATAKAFDELTHRVVRSIESFKEQ